MGERLGFCLLFARAQGSDKRHTWHQRIHQLPRQKNYKQNQPTLVSETAKGSPICKRTRDKMDTGWTKAPGKRALETNGEDGDAEQGPLKHARAVQGETVARAAPSEQHADDASL